MKKIFTTLVAGAMSLSFMAAAQNELPDKLDGFYRMTNAGYQEALTARNHFDIGGALPDPSNAGSVFRLTTSKMYSFGDEMEKLQAMLDAGQITAEQYTQMFMTLMNVTSWKSGFFPLTRFETQGVNYMEMLERLPDIADDALENFINTEASNIYNNYKDILMFLCAVSTDIIKPVDLESEATFTKWLEKYLTSWRSYMDFGLYLHPVYTTPEEGDNETPTAPTGEYYFEFHTPIYVGSMEKAQLYINNMLSNNGQDPEAEQLDIWGTAKHYMMMEIEKKYPEGSDGYNFIKGLLGDSKMNAIYIIGENEEGGLKLLELPDAFNTQGITITADDLAQCTWKFDLVNEDQPFAAPMRKNTTDADGYHYTTMNLAFPVRILSSGIEVYTATAVDFDTELPTLEKVSGDVIPAMTPVVLKNKSAEPVDNKLLPLDDETTPLDGGALTGTLFPMENDGECNSLGDSTDGPRFCAYFNPVPANSAYYHGKLSEIKTTAIDLGGEAKVYDLFGREVKNREARGLYIVNGKKVIK